MLKKVSKALLLTDVASFGEKYMELADSCEVELTVASEWSTMYRVKADVIICGSKYLDKINPAYISLVTILLGKEETPHKFIQQGVERFIFDYKNKVELSAAFYKAEKEIKTFACSEGLQDILKESEIIDYHYGDYDFKFAKNDFKYKRKPIYLTKGEKNYLAEWLLKSHKDNSKRIILFNLRKRFGQQFLREVSKYGEYKGETNEQ